MDAYLGSSVIAICAPEGTVLDVPDPYQDMPLGKRRFQVYLKSPSNEGVDVFLVKGSCVGDSSIEHGTDAGYGGVSGKGYETEAAARQAVAQVLMGGGTGGRERAGSIDRKAFQHVGSVPSTPDILRKLPESTLQEGFTPSMTSLPSSPSQLVEDAMSLQAFSSPMKKAKMGHEGEFGMYGNPPGLRTPECGWDDRGDQQSEGGRGGGRNGDGRFSKKVRQPSCIRTNASTTQKANIYPSPPIAPPHLSPQPATESP